MILQNILEFVRNPVLGPLLYINNKKRDRSISTGSFSACRSLSFLLSTAQLHYSIAVPLQYVCATS